MYVRASCSAHEEQKKAIDSLELELQIVVRCQIGAGSAIWAL